MYEDDRELVRRMLARDPRAFDAFFSAYARRLAAFVSRRSNLSPAGLEDVVQNSLLKAVRSLSSFRGDAALYTWLCAICRHELVSLHRKVTRQPAQDSLDSASSVRDTVLELRVPAEFEPPNELALEEHRGGIAQTLNGLPERYARALEWKYGDGFSVQQIARMLGLSTIAAQSLLARAREAFKAGWRGEQPQ